MNRPRLLIPFLTAAGLFALYAFLNHEPLNIRGIGDVRYILFGEELKFLHFAAFVPLIFFIVRVIDLAVFDWAMSQRRNVTAPLLLREIVSIGLFVILVGVAMTRILGSGVTGWLATGTVLAAILGLAMQETLGNLFAGIALHLEDSFEIGDVIRSGDYIGVVEGARWRGTRLRTFNNTVIILPNSMLARERLEVYPRRNLNARLLSVGIDYSVPPATVMNVLTQAMRNVEGISHDLPPLARVAGFGESAIQYELKYFMHDYSQRDRIDADIRKAVWYALKRNEISIAFPVRAYQMYQPPAREDHDLSPEEVAGALKDVDLLSPLEKTSLEAISRAARVHFFSKGESIISRGTVGDSMFIVHSGTVSVRIASDDQGHDHEVAQLGPGSVFGEMALLTGETRTADVVAVTDVHAIEISKGALAPVLQDHPELASAISAKVMERQGLNVARAEEDESEETSVVSRIRAWFGL